MNTLELRLAGAGNNGPQMEAILWVGKSACEVCADQYPGFRPVQTVPAKRSLAANAHFCEVFALEWMGTVAPPEPNYNQLVEQP